MLKTGHANNCSQGPSPIGRLLYHRATCPFHDRYADWFYLKMWIATLNSPPQMTLWGKHPRHDQSISTLGSETMLKIGQARSQTQVLSLAALSLSYPFMTGTFMSSISRFGLLFPVHHFMPLWLRSCCHHR